MMYPGKSEFETFKAFRVTRFGVQFKKSSGHLLQAEVPDRLQMSTGTAAQAGLVLHSVGWKRGPFQDRDLVLTRLPRSPYRTILMGRSGAFHHLKDLVLLPRLLNGQIS